MDKKVVKRSLFSYIFLFAIILGVFYFINVLNTKVNDLTYSEFLTELDNNKVTELTITPNSSQGVYSITGKLDGYNENESFIATATYSEETIRQIYEIQEENKKEIEAKGEEYKGVEVNVAKDPGSSWFVLFLVNVLPIILLLGVIVSSVTLFFSNSPKNSL